MKLNAKHVVFSVIGLATLYVLYHNERFLVDSSHPAWQHYGPFKWWLLPHGVFGAIVILFGPLQFSDRLRQRFTKAHRVMGRFRTVAGAGGKFPGGSHRPGLEGDSAELGRGRRRRFGRDVGEAFRSPQTGWGDGTTNRGTEYNTPDDKYARVITEELMPVLYKEYSISKDPEMHGIGGSSSGAIAAFTVAWERPDHFRKVLSNVGSFVNLRGGHRYADLVAEAERKPIRVYLCDGRNDNRGQRGGKYDEKMDWFYQNVRLMKALTKKGYDVNYAWGMNAHGQKFGGAILPDMMRWLWRDGPVSTDPNDKEERSFRQPAAKKE